MERAQFQLVSGQANIVGSFGSLDDLRNAGPAEVAEACDLVEIRLDLLKSDGHPIDPGFWRHLEGTPLLFTARRKDEGGAGHLSPAQRMDLLKAVTASASLIDIEVASTVEMRAFLENLTVPWVASYHDFEKLSSDEVLADAARRAKDAGAAAFKAAARLHSPADISRLADFQLGDHGIPVSTMGMGPLAPVSRLLCAQCGSVLNYGYIGSTPTAPGQWDAALLKQAVARLATLHI
jgi:3-dehydroquinate dehydratase I